MSRIFFSTKILLRPPAGDNIACSIPRYKTGNRLYKPFCFDPPPGKILLVRFLDPKQGIVSTNHFGFEHPPRVKTIFLANLAETPRFRYYSYSLPLYESYGNDERERRKAMKFASAKKIH